MEVAFTADQEAFIRQAIASGRYRSPEDAVRDAMTRWEESERSRLRLLTAFNEAEADVESGDFTDYTDENHSTLASQLKREARASREQP